MIVKFKDSTNEEKIELKKGKTIEDLLKRKKINTETVITKINGDIVPVEDKLKDGDVLEIIRFVSSG